MVILSNIKEEWALGMHVICLTPEGESRFWLRIPGQDAAPPAPAAAAAAEVTLHNGLDYWHSPLEIHRKSKEGGKKLNAMWPLYHTNCKSVQPVWEDVMLWTDGWTDAYELRRM